MSTWKVVPPLFIWRRLQLTINWSARTMHSKTFFLHIHYTIRPRVTRFLVSAENCVPRNHLYWIFRLFRTGFLLPVQPAKINFEIDFCMLKSSSLNLIFQTWFFKNQVQMDGANAMSFSQKVQLGSSFVISIEKLSQSTHWFFGLGMDIDSDSKWIRQKFFQKIY